MVRRPALLFLSLLFALPLLAGFGPERAVTGSNLLLANDFRQEPRIASNGDGYLVTWYDHRAGTFGVYGARVAADGTLLDPAGFYIARTNRVEIVRSGESYVAFWPRPDIGGLYAATISTEGVVSAPKLALDTPKLFGITDYDVATNGKTILVATSLNLGALLELDGTFIGSMPLAPQTNLLNVDIEVATSGDEYLVAYGMNTGLMTQRVSASGQPSATVTHPGTPRSATIALASDGAGYFAVAVDKTIYGQRISRENAAVGELRVLAPAQTISGFDQPSTDPSVVWRGGEYLVAFGQKNDTELFTMRVAADGAPLAAPVPFDKSQSGGEPRLAARSGASGAAVWIDRNSLVQFAPFDAGGLAAKRPLSYTAAAQVQPALVRANDRLVAVWRERRETGEELRIGFAGGEPRVIAPVSGMTFMKPEVVFDGTTIWVVWIDENVRYRRYTAALEPLDAAPVRIEAPAEWDTSNAFSLAAGREGALLMTESSRGLLTLALHVEGGNVLIDKALVPVSTFRFHHPQAVWDGARYVVAFAHDLDWSWWQMPQPVRNEILLARVSREGTLLDAEPVVIAEAAGNDVDVLRIARGSDGSFIVAWQDIADTTYLARFTGSAKPTVKLLPSRQALALGPLVAVPDGYVVFRHDNTDVQYERLALDLGRTGAPELLPRFQRSFDWDPFYRVETAGGRLYVMYMRATPNEPQYGGVPRLFWRTDDDGAPRRRAVR